jgi:hypothetical protein
MPAAKTAMQAAVADARKSATNRGSLSLAAVEAETEAGWFPGNAGSVKKSFRVRQFALII